MKYLAVRAEKIIILVVEDRARAVITSASINATKAIATRMIAFHTTRRTRAISRKVNTEMKRMNREENNPDWLCDYCGRAGKIRKIVYPSGSIQWNCSECFHERVGNDEPRLHGKFRRYRTDNLNLTVSVNEYNNAVDKIEFLMKEITKNEQLPKKLAKIINIIQRYFNTDNFYTYSYSQEDMVNDLISIGVLERRGNHVGSPEPAEHLTKPALEGINDE